MAMGRRSPKQPGLWIAHHELPESPGHPFYRKLNELLHEAVFDEYVESLCAPYYRDGGRPSIPPGRYFRMLLVGYFEGISSQRGIAWRCQDSLSIRTFLGLAMDEDSPDHSSLTRVRTRLPLEAHMDVFEFVLHLAVKKKLLKGKKIAIDATTLEANAAMKSIRRKKSGQDYKAYLKELASQAGIEDPTEEDLRRFDRNRPGKKVSNEDWKSETDPESRITRMKDGRTRLGYKAEHAVDLDSELIVSARILPGDAGDAAELVEAVEEAKSHLSISGSRCRVEDVTADKGYYSTQAIEEIEELGIRSYLPEPGIRGKRRWKRRPESQRSAVYANRRRMRTKKGRRLQRRRCEVVERSFAHVCVTGGARRTWLRGIEEILKRYVIQVAARNLGVILRTLFGVGTPRGCGSSLGSLLWLGWLLGAILRWIVGRESARSIDRRSFSFSR